MAWFNCGNLNIPIQFTKTKIVDNASKTSTLSFSEDYHNYDLLLFRCVCSNDGNEFEVLTTPDIVDEIFDKSVSGSTHSLMFNESGTNHYVGYKYISNTEWLRFQNRYIDCTEVYGVTCNKTITKTTLYQRGNFSGTATEITIAGNFFDYDFILGSTCDGNYDDTVPCDSYINLLGISTLNTLINFKWVKYGDTSGWLKTLTSTKISSGNYFMVQGIKFT